MIPTLSCVGPMTVRLCIEDFLRFQPSCLSNQPWQSLKIIFTSFVMSSRIAGFSQNRRIWPDTVGSGPTPWPNKTVEPQNTSNWNAIKNPNHVDYVSWDVRLTGPPMFLDVCRSQHNTWKFWRVASPERGWHSPGVSWEWGTQHFLLVMCLQNDEKIISSRKPKAWNDCLFG